MKRILLTLAAAAISLFAANAEEKTKTGIILTAASQEKPQIAEVVAVGPGGLVDGKEVKMTVKVGDKVIVSNIQKIRPGMPVTPILPKDNAQAAK